MGNRGSSAKIVEIHSSSQWRGHLEASKQSNKLVVIDFSANWCGPCKMMEPTIEEYANMYDDVEFLKIDVDTLPDVAGELKVDAMPTFVLVKKGKEVCRLVGARKTELQKLIEKHRLLN
ncbi:Thioredoxin H2 [Hibiscus syriacus]|uniref:Thioredoxin H2 n=1 Tax=Hibiscus syriacus TaxID=106335 RepID=A0A6A3BAR2_HIBSY|nr:thioredoxin H2-like [Hibiscus syriacus]KAE8713523.1 Thioredoxin H2 [Hibiscus syriacus]